jgi:hypothetical protein
VRNLQKTLACFSGVLSLAHVVKRPYDLPVEIGAEVAGSDPIRIVLVDDIWVDMVDDVNDVDVVLSWRQNKIFGQQYQSMLKTNLVLDRGEQTMGRFCEASEALCIKRLYPFSWWRGGVADI